VTKQEREQRWADARHEVTSAKSGLLKLARELEAAKMKRRADALRTIVGRLETWQTR
jgi:hypothetical protein